MSHIAKTTSKGQVTLPVKWRKKFETNRFLMKEQGDSLIITPLETDVLDNETWDTIFDAKRDHHGKGVPLDVFLKTLKKTL